MMITYSEKFSEADHGLAITQSIAAVVNHFAECAPFFPHVLICFLACSRAETDRYIIMCINRLKNSNKSFTVDQRKKLYNGRNITRKREREKTEIITWGECRLLP